MTAGSASVPDLAHAPGSHVAENSLFARLRTACRDDWQAYIDHEFVQQLADGTLPEACFRHYLAQDYLFLIHFARAHALAAYKSDNLADVRQAAAGLSAIVDTEMRLHVEFCADWGLSEADMESVPEATGTMAYTRYVLEKGLSGDLLDLHVALAPCMVGYAEIGNNLVADRATLLEGNPYRAWIEMYAGKELQDAAGVEIAQLDRLLISRLGSDTRAGPRFDSLVRIFREATQLETAFWQMGLSAAG